MMAQIRWTYGVTTVPQRLDNLLPYTLASLRTGGFDNPRLFIDGARDGGRWSRFGFEMTVRTPTIQTYGNWLLALLELYLRDSSADRYAIFQDDFMTYCNLRQYLESCKYPNQGYWNLYTFPENQKLARDKQGWYPSNQRGKGAVALIFNGEAMAVLLSHKHMIDRISGREGKRSVDGGVLNAMRKSGWTEYVHNPSLVQHTGLVSSMSGKKHPLAESFKGEDFDAMELLK